MELKDCPYCGSSNVNDTTKPEGDPTLSMGCCWVCPDCVACGPYMETAEQATEAWNARDNTELEHCCKMLIGAGISTGHASSFTDLVEECLVNVVEARSPWISCDDALEGEVVLVKIYVDQGMGHGHNEYKEMAMVNGVFPNPDGGGLPIKYIVGWQPISEIPK